VQRLPVGVFSLEMTSESLVLRMLCSRSRVNLRSVREGFLAERDFPKLTGAAGKLANAPLFIDDSSALSILQLRAKARRMSQQYGIKLFVIDYLQLLHSTARRAENRQQEIAESERQQALAKELSVRLLSQPVEPQLQREKNRRALGPGNRGHRTGCNGWAASRQAATTRKADRRTDGAVNTVIASAMARPAT
jgi:replicative DNA helicase